MATSRHVPTPAHSPILKRLEALRWALFVVGGTLIVLNARILFAGADTVDTHLARHDAIFGTALGIGLIAVWFRPERARGLIPVAAIVGSLMAIVAVSDLARGQVGFLAEAPHLLEVGGLICLWVISGGPTRLRQWTTKVRLPNLQAKLQTRELRVEPHPFDRKTP